MPRALKICSHTGCTETVRAGRCQQHQREAEQRRGTARDRGYDHVHNTRFRADVLRAHPHCQCTVTHDSHTGPCTQPATDADHYPVDRRELVQRGMDPNDARHGRGLCHSCHSWWTSQRQPGGWHNRL